MLGLFMKRLAIDTSAEEIRRITTILDQHNLKYEVRTTRSRGTIGSGMDAAAYGKANLSMYKGASQPTFIYSVHVHRRDYEVAWKLVKEGEG